MLERAYRLWGREEWPRSLLGQWYRVFCECISPDTVWRDWDVIIHGGDPISRYAALLDIDEGARVLMVSPLNPIEAGIPWIEEKETREWVARQLGIDAGDFVNALEEVIAGQVARMQVFGEVSRASCQVLWDKDIGGVYVLNPHDKTVYGVLEKDRDIMEMEGILGRGFGSVSLYAPSGALKAGSVGRVLDLSAGRMKKNGGEIGDFTFPLFSFRPMSEARNQWKKRLETLLNNARKG